jgi:1,4-alpha-glucan branching enzyme
MKKWIIIGLIFLNIGACSRSIIDECGPYAQPATGDCVVKSSLANIDFIAPKLIGENHIIRTSSIPSPEWLDKAVIYEVNIRQFSPEGTFEALRRDLVRIKEMGVTILWLMPIHPISEERRKGTLGSYYSIADYYGVNPEFGTMEDFDNLVRTAQNLGLKVILDLVINHTGWDHPWISEHPEYYVQENGQIIHPRGTDWDDVAQLNFSNPDLVNELVAMTRYWVEQHNIDGYRADVAGLVPVSVWEKIHTSLLEVNPEVFMLAEDHSVTNWFDVFHSNYGGWELMKVFRSIANGNDNDQLFFDYLTSSHRMYPIGNFPMIFTTNHDENSWNGLPKDHYKNHLELVNTLTFLLPGLPLIYNGQESSLEKQLLFFEKDQIEWNDYDLMPKYEELYNLKRLNPALFTTNHVHSTVWIEDQNPSVLSFLRQTPTHENKVLVIANLSTRAQTSIVHLSSSYRGYYRVWKNNELVLLPELFEITLEPLEIKVFTFSSLP